MASFIEVKNVTKHYGNYTALNNVSLEVAEGEFLALLGPSGCGKTTLLRSIAGFIDSIEGDISIDGVSLLKLPPNRRPVNTVFQNYALFPHMTVLENVAYGPRRNGSDRRAATKLAEESLATVGMSNFAKRYPAQLSGGQQQRIALARAIANRPKVLLLDEPLSALDLKLRKQMQMELKALQKSLKMTFIFVTHDQEEALVMADRIAVMEAGNIVQIGSGEDIYHAPASRYVADFIGDANLIGGRMAGKDRLEIAGRTFDVALPPEAKPDAKITCLIRPEAVMVLQGQPNSEMCTFDATVERSVFIGNASRIYLTANGQEFVCQIPSADRSVRYEAGQTLNIGWHKDNMRVLVQ